MVNLCAVWTVLFGGPILNLLDVQVDYRLFTPNVPGYKQFNIKSYNEVTFDSTKKYIILAHGWIDGFTSDWYDKTITEFSTHPNTIVIAAGYEEAMNCQLYFGSVLLLDHLASDISHLVLHMNSSGVPLSNIEFVGHSLGAHISGITGKKVFKATGKKISKIFGLDPAAPLIPEWPLNNNYRLLKEDADRVIVFHTSLLGMQTKLGHADFYPNGGLNQGECGTENESSHVVATMYFFCSINNECHNVGYQCESYSKFDKGGCRDNSNAVMGYNIANDAVGTYYLNIEC